MLFETALSVGTVVISAITMYIVAKKTAKDAMNDAEDRIFSYIESPEAIQDIGTLGAAFGRGLMTQLPLGTGKKSDFKIAGIKIPQALIDVAIAQITGKKGAQPLIGDVFGQKRTT